MTHSDDKALIDRVVAKDRAAFDEFFNAYFDRLYRFAAGRMPDNNAIEDVVQETLFKAIRGLANYRGEAQLFTWLCQICRNEVSNWYTKHGKRDAATLSLDDDPDVRAVLESLQSDHQLDLAHEVGIQRLVQLTLDYLPDQYGKALEWKYLDGLSVDEIGQRLGTTKIAAQSILARARTAFRQCIKDLNQAAPATPAMDH